ncbi:MAG: hypothetical protein JWL69_2164 [Phycisphaerales bacterium]|nr:hypothetical protein [Phycisphaerales bacterium]MDB5357392.1 hypothetical protein [Phycisphaerales bacterium]
MHARRTQLLALLLVVATATSALGYWRMDKMRRAAEACEGDMAICRRDLADLARWQPAPSDSQALSNQSPELSDRVRQAATAANVAAKLVSIEPGNPTRVENSDYEEMPVFLRFEELSLGELAGYLAALAHSDPGLRSKSIELEPPRGQAVIDDSNDEAGTRLRKRPAARSDETWTADVTISYLVYAPRKPDRP